jgi:hypothetical protein
VAGWALVLVGLVVMVAAAAFGASGRRVPATAAVLGPLAMLVGTWARFGAAPDATAAHLATLLAVSAPVGWVMCAGGVLMVAGGIGGRARGSGSPALVQIGVLSVAIGMVWAPWMAAQSQLFAAWGAPLETVRAVQVEAIGRVRGASLLAAVVLCGWAPAAVWAARTRGRRAVVEALGSMALVLIATSTVGRWAGEAMGVRVRPWRTVCERMEEAGVAFASGPQRVEAPALVRPGPQVFVGGAWRTYEGQSPVALVLPANATWAQALAAAEGLPHPVSIAGVDLSGPEPWLFRRHPVVASARCGVTPLDDLRRRGPDPAASIRDLVSD